MHYLKWMVVKGTFSTRGQFQIIIGSGTVNKVFHEMEKITGKEASTTSEYRSWWFINGIKQYSDSKRFIL